MPKEIIVKITNLAEKIKADTDKGMVLSEVRGYPTKIKDILEKIVAEHQEEDGDDNQEVKELQKEVAELQNEYLEFVNKELEEYKKLEEITEGKEQEAYKKKQIELKATKEKIQRVISKLTNSEQLTAQIENK